MEPVCFTFNFPIYVIYDWSSFGYQIKISFWIITYESGLVRMRSNNLPKRWYKLVQIKWWFVRTSLPETEFWFSDVLTSWCWWQYLDVGDRIEIWLRSPLFTIRILLQQNDRVHYHHLTLVTNIPVVFTNIRHSGITFLT